MILLTMEIKIFRYVIIIVNNFLNACSNCIYLC